MRKSNREEGMDSLGGDWGHGQQRPSDALKKADSLQTDTHRQRETTPSYDERRQEQKFRAWI